jgi:hypothetical protein
MMTKYLLAAVSLYLAAEGFSLVTAPASLLREAIAKASQQNPPAPRDPA